MQLFLRFCLSIVVCSFLQLYFQYFLLLSVMNLTSCINFLAKTWEFSGGSFVVGCFSTVFNILGLFFMFSLGLNCLRFSWFCNGFVRTSSDVRERSIEKKKRLSSIFDLDKGCDQKIVPSKSGPLKLMESSNSEVSDDDCEGEFGVEDEESDVTVLREVVKIERRRANRAYAELEEERIAAASAAGEAMSLILRLQSEKSSLLIDANQFRRSAEQKQEYDRQVIQYLQRIITKHELEGCILEEKLESYREKLNQFMTDDEMERYFRGPSFSSLCPYTEGDLEDVQEEDFADLLYNFSID